MTISWSILSLLNTDGAAALDGRYARGGYRIRARVPTVVLHVDSEVKAFCLIVYTEPVSRSIAAGPQISMKTWNLR